MRLAILAVLVSAAAAAQVPPAPRPAGPPGQPGQTPRAAGPGAPVAREESPANAGWLRDWDAKWKHRDEAGVEDELGKILKEHLASEPASFEANWRAASLANWRANGTSGDDKADLGKAAWAAADKAIFAKPGDVHGHYHAAAGIGLYSEGIGILSALSQGLEGKFRDRAQAALRLDRDFLDGAPQVVWGRYFFKLPWPKRDLGESIRVLSAAVKSHPRNLRAKLYLADSLAEDGNDGDAKKLVQQILDAPLGDDPPEDRRVKADAQRWGNDR